LGQRYRINVGRLHGTYGATSEKAFGGTERRGYQGNYSGYFTGGSSGTQAYNEKDRLKALGFRLTAEATHFKCGVMNVAIISRITVRIGILAGVGALIIYFLWLVRGGLYPFIIAFLLAYLLNPAVRWLESKHLKRVWAIIVVYVILFTLVIVGGSQLLPLILRELESFGRELPMMTTKCEELVQVFQMKYQNSAVPVSLRLAIDNSLQSIQIEIQVFVARLVACILDVISHFIGIIITPVLAFYLLHDWHEIGTALLRVAPGSWRRELVLMLQDIVFSGVIRGQLFVAFIVCILVSLGLLVLGVRYALIIGILAGMLDIIPYFGAFIGATPAVTVALLSSPWLAVKVALLFFIIHQLEGTIISPMILGEKAGLHPLIVIFFLFVGGEFAGLAGMLLGVPLAALGKVVLHHLLKALI